MGLPISAETRQELDKLKENADRQLWQAYDNSDRLLGKLKRRLKPKIWQGIQWELNAHTCLALEIVSVKQVKGYKRTGHEYFGQSTAIRHVYDHTSMCSLSGSYGGNVYLYLGNKQYLMMFVSG